MSFMNPTAETLTGWTLAEAQDKPLDEIFRIANEQTGEPIESPVAKVLREGLVVGLANHTVLVAKDDSMRPIEDTAAPIKDDDTGTIRGVVLVFRDVTEQRERRARAGPALSASCRRQTSGRTSSSPCSPTS